MSSDWHAVTSFPLKQNLSPLLSQLKKRGFTCHVTEEKGRQQLWIGEKCRVVEATQLSSQWNSKGRELDRQPNSRTDQQDRGELFIFYLLRYSPVNITIILMGLLGALLVHFDTNMLSYAHFLLFQPLANGALQPFSVTLESGQYWRLLTPIFLHFGTFHILFNGAILWSMGTRIERAKSSFHYLLLVVVVGTVSNIAQYLAQPNAIFGGLSGVVYGVIGYIAVYQTFITHPLLQFSRSIIVFFIVWLLLGFTGVIDLLIPGKVANASHLSGLIAGAVIGYLVALRDKYRLTDLN